MRTSTVLHLLLCAFVAFAASAPAVHADAPPKRLQLVVVVAKKSKLRSLTKAELRKAFIGESITVNGERLFPLNFAPSSPERVLFDRAVLGMRPDEVGRFWVDRKIRGQTEPPRAVPSAAYVAKIVARFPGAIGYLPADLVPDNVAVVEVDGARILK